VANEGFVIHHGIGKEISLNRWIASKKDLITMYSSFYVSAGAIIIHDGKILLVQEKNGARQGDFGIPGGRADFGETISSCAERELM
jgi:8-oxo-dGTP pyrophosphatase MutT (NUDIX family)